jgi:hypothetical protein
MPDRESATDDAPRRGIGRQIAALVAIGLIFRLILAYGIDGLRGSGFGADLGLFNYWADTLAQHGPWGFYANASYADYTPGYLYALWPVGVLREVLGAAGVATEITDSLIKLPAIITDVLLGYLVASMALELGVTRRRALIAAAVVIFNPITWFDSVIWGQVDSFGTLFLLLGMRELWRGRHERAAVLAVVAALIKPQLAILVPIVAVVAIRRALWPAGGYGDEPEPRRRGFSFELQDIGWLRILTTGAAGFLTAVLLSAPFGLTVIGVSSAAPFLESSLLRLVFSTAATYPFLSVNAYNWWALFPVDGQSVATAGGALWMPDSPVPDAAAWGAIGPVPAALVGAALLLGTAAVVAWVVARHPDRLTILVGVSVLALAFFAAPTRVHERYLFPFFGLAAILFAFSTRWRVAYVVAGVATFLNMYVVLVALYPDNPGVSDWLGIGEAIRSSFGVTTVALLHSAAFIWGVLQLRPGARRALAVQLERGRIEEKSLEPEPETHHPLVAEPGAAVAASVVGADGVLAASADVLVSGPDDGPVAGGQPAGAAPTAATRLVPAWYDRPSWTEMGPIAWLRARVGETPFRPDRSASLDREPRGRVDRLDLFLLIVFVVGALVLRTYRVGDPARMHFDEVYHARTATEFLQAWRYDISHDIYEWTHPHLAKYAMAAGIVAFAGHDVASASDLGVPVRDAAVEPRREDPSGSGDRAGDRAWVATGSEVVAYDLATRGVVARWALPGASALAFDETGLQALVGTDAGDLYAIDAATLDAFPQADPANPEVTPFPVTTVGGPVTRIAAYRDGSHAAVILADGSVAVVDLDAAEVVGTAALEGATDLAAVDDVTALLVLPAVVEDPEAVAAKLAEILGGEPATYLADLTRVEEPNVRIDAVTTIEERTALKAAMDAGLLAGVELQPVSTMAVADGSGVTFLDVAAATTARVELEGGAAGLAQVSGVDEGTQVYATSTDAATGDAEITVISITGDRAENGPEEREDFPLPGSGTRVVFDAASELVFVLGTTPDGTGTTVYVVEPHGKSVFADHRLPFAPTALVLDHNKDFPTTSHGSLLPFAAGGEAVSLDVGSYTFAWRMPGVIMGALTVAVLFLLARILFRRRSVAVLVGLFALLDGMLFVQSRIAMNDVYTAFFILAAYLLFAWLWLEPERVKRSFWLVMPAMGVLLGLALASKWVAAYAIGALGILVLIRSALGRVLLIIGMIGITGLLGWMGLSVPVDSGGAGNLPFILIMIGLTLATVALTVYRPVAWSDDEMRFAVAAPAAAGILIAFTGMAMGSAEDNIVLGPVQFTAVQAGFALVLVGLLAYAAFNVGGRLGVGPMKPAPAPDAAPGPPPASPAPEGWVRLGWGLGLPAVWLAACLLAIPLAVYVLTYLPWAMIENHRIVDGWPAGNTGETLLDLTRRMYEYHNNLTAAHAASSPWWAWPLNLKPVWFYQGSYAYSTSAAIYDAGNTVIWWLGIPAMVFVAFQAYRRRSLALALILIAFLAQWVSWARIDRAAFQYHYYTSLPFVILALGYFVAEIWHGASRRTWLLVRAAAAVAIMGPVILWLLRYPLCALAEVESVNAGSQACNGNPGNLVVTPATAAMVVVSVITVLALVWILVGLGRQRPGGRSIIRANDLLPLVLVASAGGAAMAVSRLLPDGEPLFTVNGIVPEIIALIVAVPLGLMAIQVLTARDARRFVTGLIAVTAAWFVILYPNISALAMPSTIVNAYQGLLPTYLYAFQFGVDTIDRGKSISFADPKFAILMVFLVVASGVVAYSAWAWRQALAPDAGSGEGSGGAAGAASGSGPG